MPWPPMVAAGALPVAELIGTQLPLDRAVEALDLAGVRRRHARRRRSLGLTHGPFPAPSDLIVQQQRSRPHR